MILTFITPELVTREAITIPASGKTRRLLQARLLDEVGKEVKEACVTYEITQAVEGIWIQEDILYMSSAVKESQRFEVVARVVGQEGVEATLAVEVIKDHSLQDAPPSPIEKEGWELFYHEEFQGNDIDWRKWSPYYLRSWTEDELAKADFYFEDGKLVITAKPERAPWCDQDGGHRVSGIQSFERTHLHRFGTVTGARNIPDFDGFATKYGYFEVRMRLPDTKDGSHFAWWMIGVQDDQHITAQVEGSEQYTFGVFSNQTAEFDVVEQTLDAYTDSKDYEAGIWRPVIHPNGSEDLKYLWVAPTPIKHGPNHEYHVYGFEWDETGTKFYLDGELVQATDRTPTYRMMTLFSLYLGARDGSCGMGTDRGIYPKEAWIDYFRVYKKKEVPRVTSISINDYHSPSYLRIPEKGVTFYKMTANAMDQFEKPIDVPICWGLGETIQGVNLLGEKEMSEQGIWIHPVTGEVSVEARARENQDIFVVAMSGEGVREVKHLKLSKEVSHYEGIRFATDQHIVERGSKVLLHASVYDQYGEICTCKLNHQLAQDLTGNVEVCIDGIQIDEMNRLVVDKNVPSGTYLYLVAEAEGIEGLPRACKVLKVI